METGLRPVHVDTAHGVLLNSFLSERSKVKGVPGLVSAGLLMLIFNNLAAVWNYVFQAMMARHLGTADFGLMNALFGAMTFLSLPVAIYSSIFMRQWAELCNAGRHAEAESAWWAMIVSASGVAALGAGIAAMFAYPLAWFLNTTNFTAVGVTIGATAVSVVLSLAIPLATARQWFGALAAGAFFGCLLRLGLGWLAIGQDKPMSGAVAATALSGAVLAFLVGVQTPWPGWKNLPFHTLRPHAREWIAPLLTALASFMILGVDILIVRRVYTLEDSGRFAQVMILGRIIFFIIGPIASVVLPKTATSLEALGEPNKKRVVRRALGMSFAILVTAALGICVFAPLGFQLLRGKPADVEMLRVLRLAVWCLIPLSLCQLVLPAFFARRQERWLMEFTLLSLLLPLGLVLFHKNLAQAFLVEGAVGVILLAFAAWRVTSAAQPRNG